MYYVWVVCDNRCKDVYLPDHANWNGEIALSQNDTGWTSDIRIPIRTLDNICYVSCPKGFTWENRKSKRGEVKIQDLLGLEMQKDQHRISLLFSKCDIRTTVFKKFLLPKKGQVAIGRSGSCAIRFSDPSISSVHGTLNIEDGACQYTDSSSFGSYVNGMRLKGYYRLRFGDVVTLASGVKFVYLRDIIAVNNMQNVAEMRLTPARLSLPAPVNTEDEEVPSLITYHHRTIRIVEAADETAVEIEPPPNKAEKNQQPMWLTLGPSMTMILPMAMGVLASGRSASGLVMIGTSSVVAVFWGLMNTRYRKKEEVRLETKRQGLYKKYIEEVVQKLRRLNEKEFNRLMLHHPDVGQCAMFPSENRLRLWERMPTHADFMFIRLGKGNVPLPGPITTQQQRLSMIDDPLRDEPDKLIETFSVINNAPVTLSLRQNPMVGILGTEKAAAFAKGLVMQLAVLHSYHDVRICILTEEGQRSEWEWARWLPHVFASEDRLLRMVVSTAASRQDVLSHLDEVLSMRIASLEEERGGKDEETEKEAMLPHYVVVCTNPELLDKIGRAHV